MTARYFRVHLVDPTHRLAMPGTQRLFNQGPEGEVVDVTDSFWDALLADGSLALGPGDLPAPQPDRPSPDIVGESPILVDYEAAVKRFVARLDPSVALISLEAGAGIAISNKDDDPNAFVIENTTDVQGTTLQVDLATTDAISIPHPKIGAGSDVPVVARVPLWNGARILTLNQASGVDNGPWVYDLATNTLSRPGDYRVGLTVTFPFYVEVADNDDAANSGTVWQIARKTTGPVVGTSPTEWVSVASGAGRYSPGQFLAGPFQPSRQPYQATPRQFAPADQPLFRNSQSITGYPKSIFSVVNLAARTSSFVDAKNPFSQQGAFNALLAQYRTVRVDKALYLTGRPTLLSGRRIIFEGSGPGGPVRVFMMTPGSNIFLFNGLHDVIVDGEVIVEYPLGCSAGVSAFKISDSASNIRISSLWTKGVDYALEVSHGTISGLSVGELGVDNPASESPLRLLAPGTVSGHGTIRVASVRGVASRYAAPDANFSFVPLVTPQNVVFSTLTANRIVTLSTSNMVEGYKTTFANYSGSGYTVTIGALGAVANGQELHANISAGVWARTA